ncbi:ABC transporter ATP-binding protein [Xenophilus sp. Marseille-Q4582]|uniref:ABC transporter ATP-binding protein n=1 Tax=Xenophilus sp. Marseille-Q4582 TaxID=2866600 RepID=UPI001CE4506E|nr:ABC transporter ATP-binding protein [Xenophilus sp. Marseille-Q4582]
MAAGALTADAASPVLRLAGISKRFGTLQANDDISLALHAGEVLALLGENGAGKSTLMSILFGHYTADAGQVEVFGAPLPPGNPRAALEAGVGMVHQHFTLADNLSVLDNVMLGSEPLWQPFSRRAAARRKLLEVAQRFGLPVQPEARIGSLSVGERQRVEILKALYRGARILILDEPTAVLTPQESEALFATLGQMVAQGLAIIFISHKLPEVLRVSHRVAVLRLGRLVAQARTADCTQAQLAQWMVGHAVAVPQRRPAPSVGEVVCDLQEVHTAGGGHDRLRGLSLQLRAGEIVAIAGVSGNGQVALAELLSGTRRAVAGQARLLDETLPPSPARLAQRGVARIPEDRHGIGVVGDLAVWENAVSERLRGPAFSRPLLPGLRLLRPRAARAHAQKIIQTYDVRGGGLEAAARSLSGGNMQKLILGRALMAPEADGTATAEAPPEPPPGRPQAASAPSGGSEPREAGSVGAPPEPPPGRPKAASAPLGGSEPREAGSVGAPLLIVAHQPTWGLDIGAVAFVQQQLIAARDAGAAVLLISDDLDEVLALGDRVAVMHDGQLSPARAAHEWTREAIGLAMAGSAGLAATGSAGLPATGSAA